MNLRFIIGELIALAKATRKSAGGRWFDRASHALLVMPVVAAAGLPAAAGEQSAYSEYRATVVRVIDGDTIEVEVDLWPGLIARYSVRVRGIDAPELRRVSCDEELQWGLAAKEQALRLYDIGSKIKLQDVEYDSFSGRVVADVLRWRSDRWLWFSKEMVERNMAVVWTPDMDDVPWCLLASVRE